MYFFDLGICYLLRASIIDFELFSGIFLGSKEFLLSYSISCLGFSFSPWILLGFLKILGFFMWFFYLGVVIY